MVLFRDLGPTMDFALWKNDIEEPVLGRSSS